MSVKYGEIFSEYDITEWGIRFGDDAEATIMDTLGTAEETMEVRTVTKNKRNMPWKTRTKATTGTKIRTKATTATAIPTTQAEARTRAES